MNPGLLDTLAAEREIRQQLARYSRGLDRYEVDLWKAAWHSDATLEYRGDKLMGNAHELAYIMTLGHDAWEATSHQMTSTNVTVRGERAVTETINTAVLFNEILDSGAMVDFHARSRYLDRWSRRNGRWAIDHRHLPAADLMWKQLRVAGRLGSRCRRGRNDPSYDVFGALADRSTDNLHLVTADRDIRRQLAVHCRGVDRLDIDLLLGVWHKDGTYRDVDAGLEGSIADIAGLLTERGGTGLISSAHLVTNAVIEIGSDEAVSETYTTNVVRSRQGPGEEIVDLHSRGRLLDRWSLRDGRWALAYRENVTDFSWRQTVRGPAHEIDRERVEDPSYMYLSVLGTTE